MSGKNFIRENKYLFLFVSVTACHILAEIYNCIKNKK